MTRINVGIHPSELNNKMLIAEHREIKRIPNAIKRGRFNLKNQPECFKLGLGHVKFFYTRLGYLKKRYKMIYNECIKRGFNVTDFSSSFDNIPLCYMNDYVPTEHDADIIRQRIHERLTK